MSETKQYQTDEFVKPAPTPDIKDNEYVLTKHFDRDYAIAMIDKLSKICHRSYFRNQNIGFEEPIQRNHQDTPFIYISNHSGMAFPWDAMVFVAYYNQERNFAKDSLRVLVAPVLSETTLMNPFGIPNLWKKMGGLDASFINFETVMQQTESNVLMYPEGIEGIGKGFNNRYKMQKFHTSYVRMSVKYKADLHWISTINGEYINPYSYSFSSINQHVRKIGVPFLPITLMLVLLPLQPWLFYFGFPAKLTYVKGPCIKAYEMIDKPYDDITQQEFVELSARIRDIAQKHINESEARYGKKPFDFSNWLTEFKKDWRNFPFNLPFMWPLVYTDFDRKYKKHRSNNFDMDFTWWGIVKMFALNPIFIAYFIPILGWIPLLIKGYIGNNLNANERRKAKVKYT